MTDTKNTIAARLAALREEMQREGLSAFIFPSADPHMSEYVPERWEGRKWISGFDGSAGTAVVTLRSAALWTDSRYFIAAEQQLEGTEFQLMRERMRAHRLLPTGWHANCRMPTLRRWVSTACASRRARLRG